MLACTAPVTRPRTLADALRARADQPGATLIAGGTDIMVYMEAGVLRPSAVIDLWGCAGLRGIEVRGNELCIGAVSTHTDVAMDPRVPAVLRDAALTVGAVQIQNRGTVGGNICNSSPAGDTLPVWLALDADFELSSVRGVRRVAASDYWQGYKQTALDADELLTAIYLPDVEGEAHFRKVGTRMAQAISKVIFCGRRSRGVARLAFGAVGPVPLRVKAAEDALVAGAPVDEVVRLVREGIVPIDDVRSTRDYRARVAGNVVGRWLG